jgi:hypothetical protein
MVTIPGNSMGLLFPKYWDNFNESPGGQYIATVTCRMRNIKDTANITYSTVAAPSFSGTGYVVMSEEIFSITANAAELGYMWSTKDKPKPFR